MRTRRRMGMRMGKGQRWDEWRWQRELHKAKNMDGDSDGVSSGGAGDGNEDKGGTRRWDGIENGDGEEKEDEDGKGNGDGNENEDEAGYETEDENDGDGTGM